MVIFSHIFSLHCQFKSPAESIDVEQLSISSEVSPSPQLNTCTSRVGQRLNGVAPEPQTGTLLKFPLLKVIHTDPQYYRIDASQERKMGS